MAKYDKISLLPAFEVGEPLNGKDWNGHPYCVDIPYPCRVPGVDYSGKNQKVQFPKSYHVNTGARNAEQMGGYHQYPPYFRPDHCVVIQAKNHLGAIGNVLQLRSGAPGYAGGVAITRPLDKGVKWSAGHGVRLSVWVKPTTNLKTQTMYNNVEIRGLLDVKPKQEAWEAFTVEMWGDHLQFLYWDNVYDGAEISSRRSYAYPQLIGLNQWHHLVVNLKPTEVQNHWSMTVKWDEKRVFGTKTSLISHLVEPNSVMFGNEHSLKRNTNNGGEWLYSLVQVWELIPKPESNK